MSYVLLTLFIDYILHSFLIYWLSNLIINWFFPWITILLR